MIARTPLDVRQLSPAAQRTLGPGPGRMMAARGMMPLSPADQLAVLYQLSLEADATIADAAKLTATGLPDKLLAGTLADPALDPRVLDYFGEISTGKVSVFDAIVMNPTTSDPTIATLAGKGGSREVDLIAQNEQRLLRHPEIIAAMYMNRRARMSTIDRVVELAVRMHVRVPGLAAWDEVARALSGSPSTSSDDAMLDSVLEKAPGDDSLTKGDVDQVPDEREDAEQQDQLFRSLSIPAKIRAATLGNATVRGEAIRDPLRMVALAAIKAPGVTDFEAATYASNRNLMDDVIRYIANKREWTKLYGVKVALCRNPKTPIADSMRLLPLLREKDIYNLSKSKGVPSALVAQARKLIMSRRGGSQK